MLIHNDEFGIKNQATYDAIKKIVHPLVGEFKKGIDEGKALKTTKIILECDEIEDLDFLSFFPNLTDLSIISKNLFKIDGLKYVQQLKAIYLKSDWPWTVDISPIGYCEYLEEVDLCSNENMNTNIKGFEALSKLRKVTCLSLLNMGVQNIDFIKDMPELEDAELAKNPISNLTSLQKNLRLHVLDLSDCGISDIAFLSQIPNLKVVNLVNNKIKDFSPLKHLKKLEMACVAGNGISDSEIEKWKNELSHIDDLDFLD